VLDKGESGLDIMRRLADDELGLPIMAHPTFQGAYVVDDRFGIEHGTLFGTLDRLVDADMMFFPGYGVRFSFSEAACASIVEACASPMGELRSIAPSPGGGMSLDRFDELLAFCGRDSMLLVGGNLHRGDLFADAQLMRCAADAWAEQHEEVPA